MDRFKKTAIVFLWLTIIWNIFEGASSMYLGIQAKSLALFAYGLESSVEIFTSVVVLMEMQGLFKKKLEEKLALQCIGVAYIVVSVYIFFEGIKNLLNHHSADTSVSGIILMIVTICVMGGLGLAKHIIGRKMNSQTLLADAKFTLIDGGLSFGVLVGLVLNLFFPLWWIDQAIALILACIALKEGINEIIS